MKVSSINYSLNFGRQKTQVQKADKIQRRASLVFPAISSSYVRKYYDCYKDESKYSKKAHEIAFNVWLNISNSRYKTNCRLNTPFSSAEYHFGTIQTLNEEKKGNCAESASAVASALSANGYYNSKTASVYYKTAFLNKKNKKIEFSTIHPIDHAVVLSDMNQEISRNIVLDSWFGFAANKQQASVIYKREFENQCKTIKQNELENFIAFKKNKKEEYNPQDYVMLNKICFIESADDSIDSMKTLQQMVKEKYSDLLV